ncbi:transketolase [Brachybacterium alimentarium]|uniref:transketolase n=1 Tax=Brachybacterium alimentarium TaxID=47845 RepID=UPI000BB8172A|nr:transketolase [Brachybacterium alimentarium]PCC36123.1 transketolase [Brachybacterium alimentarium]RCS68463.1 transketolase [Brachybacterium alimentarium]RCS76953.1 transketolase [Brachybacterium alimentarium]RCS81981.1 transketolase [Brachybacterium alimentarium]RCS84207.1 transketolase [Brachybacterium alimentarium]
MTDTFKAPEGWTELDKRAVDTVRVLAADAVEKVGNGHPGTAVSLAPAAYLLYQDVMRHDPTDPTWLGRDRFVLSAGHSSLTQYIQLFLGGFGLEKKDIEELRTWGSKTPGHPENFHTKGVEITTGPLGQGISSSVGFAMAQRRERGLLDPDAAPGTSPFDHFTYVIASDGDLQEGVSSEASSLAGTQQLGNLIVLWDDNEISIEGNTSIAFTEDTAARYEAYGWDVRTVDWTQGGTAYLEDVAALKAEILEAQKVTDKPTFIRLRTVIGWPIPELAGSHAVHGAKLGAEGVAGLKKAVGFDPEQQFQVDEDVLAHTRSLAERAAADKAEWDKGYQAWRSANTEQAALLDRLVARELPEGFAEAFPAFEADEKGIATRAASGKVLGELAAVMPELWGGSADLAGSNNTTMKGEPSFLPSEIGSSEFSGDEYGRTLHFGIREHAMGAILSGISLHGLTRPYGGTFFQFADYMRGAVRLASLMKTPATYVWTHDSVGLGEDGPTHQPVEHLAAYRAIPNLSIVRPADANETSQAWKVLLERDNGPVGLILSRQAMPTFDRTEYAGAENLAKGGYVMKEASAEPQVILIGTGSELQYAAEAQKQLEAEGVPARLVSMPSVEWFDEQDEEYKESVLPSSVAARVTVEAGIAMPWHRFLGTHGRAVSLEHYGASADAKTLFREYGFTPEAVVAAAKESLAAAQA